MGEKLTAWFVTAALIAPVCAVCVLGPAVIASMFAGVVGWFGGLGAIGTAGLVLVAGGAVFALFRRRKARRPPTILNRELTDER